MSIHQAVLWQPSDLGFLVLDRRHTDQHEPEVRYALQQTLQLCLVEH